MTLKAIESAALKLPVRSRGKLAAALLSSLDAEDPAVIEREWIAEADRRFRAYRSGRTSGIPSKQAIAEARGALRK
jgi:putative addiction module component (TIGR02574 family)